LPANRLIVWGIAFELLLMLLLVYTAPGNALLGTAPFAAEVWLFIIPFGFGMLMLEELRKAVVRYWPGRRRGDGGRR